MNVDRRDDKCYQEDDGWDECPGQLDLPVAKDLRRLWRIATRRESDDVNEEERADKEEDDPLENEHDPE